MSNHRLRILGILTAIVLLVGVGVFVFYNMQTPAIGVKVYDVPDSIGKSIDPTVVVSHPDMSDDSIVANRSQQQYATGANLSDISNADTESQLTSSDGANDLFASGEDCCPEVDNALFASLPSADNPAPEAVTKDAAAYLEHVKKYDVYLAKEEELYQERQKLIESLLDMGNRDTTPEDVEAWKKKMRDWEKRSEALELTAPEPFTTEYQH